MNLTHFFLFGKFPSPNLTSSCLKNLNIRFSISTIEMSVCTKESIFVCWNRNNPTKFRILSDWLIFWSFNEFRFYHLCIFGSAENYVYRSRFFVRWICEMKILNVIEIVIEIIFGWRQIYQIFLIQLHLYSIRMLKWIEEKYVSQQCIRKLDFHLLIRLH